MSADTLPATTAPGREFAGPDRPVRRARAAWLLEARGVTVAVSLLVLLAVSAWLRTEALHFYYWVDEGISVGIASHPLSQIPGLMRQDGSPPLYYLLLHVWMAWRGSGEVATHELSLIFALATIPAAFWAGASLFDRRTGLVCALLAAGAPYLTTYAQETRMYALVALLSTIVAGAFVQSFVLRRRRYLPVFSLALALALYSHNWSLFLAVMCGVAFLWCLVRRPHERRALWRDGVLAFGAVAVLFAPWVPTVLFQAGHTGAPWDLPPVVWSMTQGLYFMAGGRGVAMLLLIAGGAGLLTLRAGVPALPAGTGVRGRIATLGAGVSRTRMAAECLLVLGFGTLLLAWLYSKTTPAWADRYLAVLVGPLVLLFGLGVARAGRLGLVALALTACFWILDPVPHNLNTKSNVASVAAQLRRPLGSDALVLSTQPEQVPTLAFYLPAVHDFGTPLGRVADPRVVNWDDALARLRRSSVHAVLAPMIAALRPGERVLLVTPVNFPKTPEWMTLIDRATARWSWFLAHDRALRRLGSSNARYSNSGSPVQATLYVRT